MKKTATLLLACMALGLVSQAAAQSISPAWDAYRKQQKAGQSPTTIPASPVPAISESQPAPLAAAEVAPAPSAAPASAPAPAPMPSPVRPRKEKARINSGAFIGVQGGKAQIYEDIDQDMWGLSTGYRWRVGSATLIGVEAAAGKLDRSSKDGFPAPDLTFYSLGATARFNFGDSPWFASARLGYWTSNADVPTYEYRYDYALRAYRGRYSYETERVYGAYAGFGVGVDLGRHASLSLMYSGYIYADDYSTSSSEDDSIDVNYADMLNLGVEVRF